ncbi:MAG: hypothetical protein J7M34_07440, partial [Anaerolineae bacterium]|nr:hypothetical protein [Anaerolineae bacterium]
QRWEYVYNVVRPHQGKGMEGQPPLTVLKRLGYDGDERIALFPTILLDRISTDLVLAASHPPGNDLLTYYKRRLTRAFWREAYRLIGAGIIVMG